MRDAGLHKPLRHAREARSLRDDYVQGRLGFRDLLVVQHHPLNISHVYVYHVEGYQPGGGLYVFTPDEQGGKLRCLVDSSQGMILSADLSYDGKEVVGRLDWHMDLHYTGKPNRGALLRAVVCASEDGMTGFGESAPAPALFEYFGITANAVAERVLETIS